MSSSKILVEQSIPLDIFNKVQSLRKTNLSGSTISSPDRHWLSNGRKMTDQTWEVLTVKFKKPASVSLVSLDLLAVGSKFEVWYTNRAGQRLPVLDQSLRQFTGSISSSERDGVWSTFSRNIYPIVATAIEIRVQRVDDGVYKSTDSVSVGIRNTYFKRNIYGRDDTVTALDDGIDSMGNSVQRTIRDWDARKGADGTSSTFWKCEPQPDPNAVVCFYLDCRDSSNNSQRVDRLWLDPAYTGQSMNLYYSNDDTVGPTKLSKVRLLPQDTSVNWTIDQLGLNLTSPTAQYNLSIKDMGSFPVNSGSGVMFMGTWVPNFDSASSPPSDIFLFRNESQGVSANNIQLKFIVSTKRLSWTFGGVTILSSPISFTAQSAVYFSAENDGKNSLVIQQSGTIVSNTFTNTPSSNPGIWGSTFQFLYNKGWLSDFAIRKGIDADMRASYFGNPAVYLTPDPVLDGVVGVIPSSTLNNVIYGADFTTGSHGFGGLDHNQFTEKTWTPMFRDWKTERGFYYFPAPVTTKYIKLEFSELVAEPYPVYESGISVKYQTFPINVLKTSKSLLTETTKTTTNTSQTVSSLYGTVNASKNVSATYNAATTNYSPDTTVSVGNGNFSDLPRTYDTPVSSSLAVEKTSSSFASSSTSQSTSTQYIQNVSYNTRQVTETVQVAKDAYYTVVKGDYLIKIAARYGIDWHEIYELNKDLIDNDPRVDRLPSRPLGWWIFPGQQLRIPGVVMENMTKTSTITERVVSTTANVLTTTNTTGVKVDTVNTVSTTRARFTTTQIHRYESKTITQRDAGIAYFSGIREVQLFKVNYVAAEDTSVYEIEAGDIDDVSYTKTNVVKGDLDSWRVSNLNSSGSIITPVWNSTSPFIKVSVDKIGNGWRRDVNGIGNIQPVIIGADTTSFWTSDTVTWGDSTVFWGATRPLGTASVATDVTIDGQSAFRISREATPSPADIGVKTEFFDIQPLKKIRMIINYYTSNQRLAIGANTYKLEIIDSTDETNIIFSQDIPVQQANSWVSFTSDFYTRPASPNTTVNVFVRLTTTGQEKETIYIGNLYTESTRTVFEVSNNSGLNYYDAAEIINTENSYLVFPGPGNKLKVRITMRGDREYIHGFSITPYYLV